MTDEELERLLRASNPASTRADSSLTMAQRSTLDRIISQPYSTPRRRWALTWLISAPVAAVLVLVLALVVHPFAAPSAAAWGPSPLTYVVSPYSLAETVDIAIERARGTSVPPVAERGAVSTSWNLHVSVSGTPERVAEIVPSVATLTWAEDLSGRLVTSVGESYRPDGTPVPVDGSAGDIIDDRVYPPGEYPALVSDVRALDRAGMESLLHAVVADPALPGDALPVVQGLLSEWTLTGEQHASLLEALLTFDHLRLLGTTTDRLGRDVIGIAAPASSGRDSTFFLSTATGRVVGVEQMVVGNNDALGVPQGTVISYTMWEDSQ